jgi:acyl-CoA synthetase (NDP forming)/ribosomal protein S18 acetylase RimI-like enzyme
MTGTSAEVVLRDGGTVLLRPLTPADSVAVQALLQSFPAPERPADPSPSADPRAAWTLVAVRGGHLLGYAGYVVTGPALARMSIAVAPELRRLGLGTLLLAELSAGADAAGIARFTTHTSTDNVALLRLLRHSGFPVRFRSRPGRVVVDHETRLPEPGRVRAERREDEAAAAAVRHVLRPASVAVIGASRDPASPGGAVVGNLVAGGFTGPVYAVNSAGGLVHGLPAYRSIREVPGPVELAIVAVPAAAVPAVARECATSGVKALLVLSAGFAEVGPEGAQLQAELLAVCREAGMRLVGPNCLGLINTDPRVRLCAIFAGVVPQGGRVGLVSQSGGLGLAAMSLADELALGLSAFVSIGNRADVSANDVLQYLQADSGTDVVLLYLESFGNPRKFARIARSVSATKPIVAVKGGRSVAGAAAAASHTGALVAASNATIDALFRQAGIIRTDTLEELLDVGTLLAHFPLPAGPRVAVIANAGGLGVLAVDACDDAGLLAPELSAGLRARLAEIRPQAATRNPIDTLPGADAETLEHMVRLVAESGEVDAIVGVWVLPGDDPQDPATRLVELAWEAPGGLPVVPVLVGDSSAGRGIAVFGAPERAVHALGHAWWQRNWRQTDQGRVPALEHIDAAGAAAIVEHVASAGGGWLTMPDVDAVLRCYGIPTLELRAAAPSPAAAATAAQQLEGPVALKALGPTLLHKSDAGAVVLNLPDAEAVRAAAERMLASLARLGHPVESLLVQRMAPQGVELIAGMIHDATFGPVLACGAGGTLTELLHDVAIRLTPLTDLDASRMVRELRTFALLDGYRGATRCDVFAVEDVLLRLSRLAEDHPQIAELDTNPLTATPRGAVVVDARIRVAASRST